MDAYALAHTFPEETFYEEIKQVSSGSIVQLVYSDGYLSKKKNIQYSFKENDSKIIGEFEADKIVAQETQQSIALYVKDYEKVMCGLSGGLDSSAIAACLASREAQAVHFHSCRSSLFSALETNLDPVRQNNTHLNDFISHYPNHKYSFYDETNFKYDYSEVTRFCYENSGSPERNPCNIPWILSFFEKSPCTKTVFLGGSYGELSYTFSGSRRPSRKRQAFNCVLKKSHFLKTLHQKYYLQKISLISEHSVDQLSPDQLDAFLWVGQRTRKEFIEEAMGWSTAISSLRGSIQSYFDCDYHTPASDINLLQVCLDVDERLFGSHKKQRDLVRRIMSGRVPESILRCRTKGIQNAGWYVSLRKLFPYYESLLPKIAKHPLLSDILDIPRLKQLMKDFKNCPNAKLGNPKYFIPFRYTLLRALHVSEWVLMHEE